MVKAGQIRRCHGLQKLGRHVVAMLSHPQCFLIDCISKSSSFVLEGFCSDNRTFCNFFHNYPLSEAGLLLQTNILNLDITNWGLCG